MPYIHILFNFYQLRIMIKHSFLIALGMMLLPLFAAAAGPDGIDETIKGSKNFVTKEVSLDNFSKIKAVANIDVKYVQQEGPAKAVINTSDNVMDYITTSVADGVLTVGVKDGVTVQSKKLDVTVYAPSVFELEVAGSGDIDCTNVTADNFAVVLSGDGDLNLKRATCKQAFTMTVSGNGDMEIGSVACESFNGLLSGDGDARVAKLTGTSVEASVTGSGDMELSGKVRLVNFSLTGTGNLNAGMLQAENGNANNTGSGSINSNVYGHLEQVNRGTGGINNTK